MQCFLTRDTATHRWELLAHPDTALDFDHALSSLESRYIYNTTLNGGDYCLGQYGPIRQWNTADEAIAFARDTLKAHKLTVIA